MNPVRTVASVGRGAVAIGSRAVGFGLGLAGAAARAARDVLESSDAPMRDAADPASVIPTPEPETEPFPSPFPSPDPGPGGPEPVPEPVPEPEPVSGPGYDPVVTPAGIEAAEPGVNPHTGESDLHQPGTEDLLDPATAKAMRSEAAMMQRAARSS